MRRRPRPWPPPAWATQPRCGRLGGVEGALTETRALAQTLNDAPGDARAEAAALSDACGEAAGAQAAAEEWLAGA